LLLSTALELWLTNSSTCSGVGGAPTEHLSRQELAAAWAFETTTGRGPKRHLQFDSGGREDLAQPSRDNLVFAGTHHPD
jgi:hypothetical protein